MNRSLLSDIYKSDWLLATGTNAGLFLLFYIVLDSNYNTDVDIFFLYKLSGGYGQPPTALLHYQYGLHPVLAYPVQWLFRRYTGINWYSLAQILFHILSCIILCRVMIGSFSRTRGLLVFGVYFLFIESRLLLNMNYSGAALTGTICGSFSLLISIWRKESDGIDFSRGRRWLLIGWVLLAGFWRLHYVALFGFGVLVAAWQMLGRRGLQKFLVSYIGIILVLYLAYQWQARIYTMNIPGWKQEERFRSTLFGYKNQPSINLRPVSGDSLALGRELLSIYFFYDSSVVNEALLLSLRQARGDRIRNLSVPSWRRWYWSFLEMRVYFLLIGLLGCYLFFTRSTGNLKRFVWIICLNIVPFLVLLFLFKVTNVILFSFLGSIILPGLAFTDSPVRSFRGTGWLYILLLISSLWMGRRLWKLSQQNRTRIECAHHIINEFNQHSDKLFIDTGSFFDLHLSVWDLPSRYPILNFIYSERVLSNSYQSVFRKYGIVDLVRELPEKKNLLLVGNRWGILREYYKTRFNELVQVAPVAGFRYMKIFSLTHKKDH